MPNSDEDTSNPETKADMKKIVRDLDFSRMENAIKAFCERDIDQQKRLYDAFRRGYDLKQKTEGSQGDRLLSYLEKNKVEKYFLSRTSEGYLKTMSNGVGPSSILKISASETKHWLADIFYEEEGKAIGNDNINNVLNIMQARARKSGDIQTLHVRVAPGPEGEVYYDLANKKHEGVKITGSGWTVELDLPVMFKRYTVMLPQVYPERGGDVNLFKKYLNLKYEDEKDFALICMITDFIPDIPHILVVCYGPPGSAKTTFSWCWRMVIDPSELEEGLSIPENNKNEFLQNLAHNYLPCFDNISEISSWASNELARAISGSGISKRALYTDDDDVVMRFRRPAMINGINVPATKTDVLDRAAMFQLSLMEEDKRRPEKVFRSEFIADIPKILGGVFDTISKAITIYPTLRLSRFPRMADFFQWGCAIAEALNISGENQGEKNGKRGAERFVELYYRNMERQSEEALKAKLIAKPLIDFLDEQPKTPLLDRNAEQVWTGTPTELLESVTEFTSIHYQKVLEDRYWPKRANTFARQINDIEIDLRKVGYKIEKSMSGHKNEKGITFLSVSPLKTPEKIVSFVPEDEKAPLRVLRKGAENIDRIDLSIAKREDAVTKRISSGSPAIDIESDIDRTSIADKNAIDAIDKQKTSIATLPPENVDKKRVSNDAIDAIDKIDISGYCRGEPEKSEGLCHGINASGDVDITLLSRLESYLEKQKSVGTLAACRQLGLTMETLSLLVAASGNIKWGEHGVLDWAPKLPTKLPTKLPHGEKVELECNCGMRTVLHPAKDQLTVRVPCKKCGAALSAAKVRVKCSHPSCGQIYVDWFPVDIPWELQRCSICKQYGCLQVMNGETKE